MSPNKENSRLVLDTAGLTEIIEQLAARLKDSETKEGPFYIVGIHRRGIPLAQRLAKLLGKDASKIGKLDINLYRDDLSQVSDMPVVRQTELPTSIEGTRLLLVDDVLYTGRTIRSALNALVDMGRPRKIELLVMVDRGGRELPIQADWRGKKYDVQQGEVVEVRLLEIDGRDEIVISQISKGGH